MSNIGPRNRPDPRLLNFNFKVFTFFFHQMTNHFKKYELYEILKS